MLFDYFKYLPLAALLTLCGWQPVTFANETQANKTTATNGASSRPAENAKPNKKSCDFSNGESELPPSIKENLTKLDEAKKKNDRVAIGQIASQTWDILRSDCANFNDANAVVWILTKALDDTSQYEQAFEMNKTALELIAMNSSLQQKRYLSHIYDRFFQNTVIQAMQAKKQDQALSLIKQYLSSRELPPELWKIDTGSNQISYQIAQITGPMLTGEWVLGDVFSTGKRDGKTAIRYFHKGNGIYNISDDYVTAELAIRYLEPDSAKDEITPDQLKAQAISARDELLKKAQPYPETLDSALADRLPDFPAAQATQIKYATHQLKNDSQIITAVWEIWRGHWHMTITAKFQAANEANAMTQLSALFKAIQWQDTVPELYSQQTMKSRLDALAAQNYQTPKQWSDAAILAKQALPEAKFPNEQAILHAIIGIDAYKKNRLDDAWSSLKLAEQLYRNADVDTAEGQYGYQQVIRDVTDVAYRLKKAEYADLAQRNLMFSRDYLSCCVIDAQQQTITFKSTGLSFPFRVAGFNATAFSYTQGALVYVLPQYDYSIELLSGLDSYSELYQQPIVIGQVKKQQSKDNVKAPLTAKSFHKLTYTVSSLSGEKQNATKWSVTWYSDHDKTEKTFVVWFFPYQKGQTTIVTTVDKKDYAVLPQLDAFVKTLAPPNSKKP